MGFCWGGAQAFQFATERTDLNAAFIFYGTPPETTALHAIRARVYGFYAGNDARVTATVAGTQIAMKQAGKRYEPVTYEGAGHGFMRAGEAPDATAPNKEAREAALKRLESLLEKLR